MAMPTQGQYDTTLQSYREIDIKIIVLDYNLIEISDITGLVENADISIDADSDIRRTANISMTLSQDSKQNMFWNVGNSYWYDKFIQIYIGINNIYTNEIEWMNQGVYMLNNPNITYEPSNNQLSFQAVDLMAKMTGMRDGNLEGMTYMIGADSSIVGAIEKSLQEAGFTKYVLNTPPIATTPYEIKIDIGGTVYDLLKELRDINANWEMYFDENGVFIFQQIPSGKVIVDPTTGETGEPLPLIDDTIWNKLQNNYQLNTDFEQVKNYVEVLGKTHEPNYWGTSTYTFSPDQITVTENSLDTTTSTGEFEWLIGTTLGDLQAQTAKLSNNLTQVNLITKNMTFSNIPIVGLDNKPNSIQHLNESYVFCLRRDASNQYKIIYYGYIQARAIAWENNPSSPFYVGEQIGGDPTFSGSTLLDGDTLNQITSNTFSISIFDLFFETNEKYSVIIDPDINISIKINLTYNFDTNSWNGTDSKYGIEVKVTNSILGININCYSNNYSLTGKLINVYIIDHEPINVTDRIPVEDLSLNIPKFVKQVRIVCIGDEYDNIFTNDLAMDRAKYEIYLRARLHDNITITTVPIYWADVNQIISYTIPNEFDEDGKPITSFWLVKSISTNYSAQGNQTINGIRYYPLYPSV